MNKKDIASHKAAASYMSIYQLTDIIKDITEERRQLASHLTSKELEKYDIALQIYSQKLEYLYALTNPQVFLHKH